MQVHQVDFSFGGDEQVIVVHFYSSLTFSGHKVHEASEMVESNSDYAEELARLQRQEHEAKDMAEKYGFGFSKDTGEHSRQADMVPAASISAGSIDPAASISAGSIDPAASISAGSAEPFPTVIKPVHADEPSLPPGHSLGSSEHSTRFPSPSDLANSISSSSEMEDIYHHPSTGIFSSSSYDADFGGMQEEMHRLLNPARSWKLFILPDRKLLLGQNVILEEQKTDCQRNSSHGIKSQIGGSRSAFLYGEIDEEVLVTQPKGFEDPHFPKHVYKVVKALYGLHQAPRAWYARLSTFLLKHNYRRDDIIFGSTKKAWCDEFEVLMKGEFEMSAMGIQLLGTPATHYYFNPKIPGLEELREQYRQRHTLHPPLQISKERCSYINVEKNRNIFPFSTLLQQNPDGYRVYDRNGEAYCVNHGLQKPPTYRYIFKALLTDQSATASVTFFTLNADLLTGSSCTELVKKYGVPDPRDFPDEILSLNGRTHIFQVHYNPSCVQGRVDFYFDDILDKPLQIDGPSQSLEPSTEPTRIGTPVQLPQTSIATQILTVTPLPITPETPGTPAEQPAASTATSIGLTEGVSSDTPSIPTTSSEITTKNVKRALFETGSTGESKKTKE
ncbi:putative ribonuclease H-like domain-containing protein [Tanacetum coccineum]|uniref:Ribonuclease H-like domain-containing protein n=1 Tax=Tanacetum coccineum TaxID=301880 RepID=A0ABQ5DUT4_9ASTR